MSDKTRRDLVDCTVAREGSDGAELDAASTWAQAHGQPCTGQEALAISTKPQLSSLQAYLTDRDLAGKANDPSSNVTTVTDVVAVVPPRTV